MKKLILPVGRRVPPKLKDALYNVYRRVTSVHRPDGSPSVMVFTMPRSGSTWLMELIWSQPGFKCVNEPFDLRNPLVRLHLGLTSWTELQNDAHQKDVQRYLQGYLDNRVHATEVAPHANTFYRPLTRRIVFKIIHAGENQIDWFRETFGVRVVFMLRHPIPVSLSNQVYPRLTSYLESDFRKRFTPAQLKLAAQVIASGSKLERGVLDWCFQNAGPLRDRNDDWAVVTYEQLVLDPEPATHYLADKLELPDAAKMQQHLGRASGVKRKSDLETKKLLDEQDSAAKRLRLVSKWQDKVSEADAKQAMSILGVFEIGVYRYDELLPARELWLGDGYPTLTAPRTSLVGQSV